VHRLRDLPPDDPAGRQVGDERGVHETAGRIDVGDVGDRPAAGRGGGEVPLKLVRWPFLPVVRGFVFLAAAPAMPTRP
jgi:hypothetical protein